MSKLKSIASVSSGVIECLTGAGLIFGWPGLKYVLKKEKYFLDCPEVKVENATELITNCTSENYEYQNSQIINVYIVASLALSFSTLFNGWFFDKFGTFAARCLASTLFLSGCLMMVFSDPKFSGILYPAMCCFSVGGILLLVTNIQTGNLFAKGRSSIITLLNGSLDSSSFMFLLVKIMYNSNLTLSFIFTLFSVLTAFQVARTLFLMPVKIIPFPLPKNFELGLFVKNQIYKKDNEMIDLNKDDGEVQEKEAMLEPTTEQAGQLMKCFTNFSFWLNVMHIGLLQVRNYFYLGTVDGHLKSLSEDENIYSYLTVFGFCQLFGACFAPLNGILLDVFMKVFGKSYKPEAAKMRALSISLLTTSMLGVVFSISCSVASLNVQYISFVLQVVFRSFLYGGSASFIALSFPGECFGKLYGVTMTVAGVIGLLLFPLKSLHANLKYDFSVINYSFVVLCALTLVHPICLWIKSNKVQGEITTDCDDKKEMI